jgi:hypothetical protein
VLSEREKADLLLHGPLGRAVLAEILGAEPYSLARAIGLDLGGAILYSKRSLLRTFSKGFRFRPKRSHETTSPTPIPLSDDQVQFVVERLSQLVTERLSSVAEVLTHPMELLEHVGSVVENYAFGPATHWHALQPALVRAKETLRPVANLMANSPEFAWWWESIALANQRWVGVNGDSPPTSIELAETLPRAIAEESRRGCWWVSLLSRQVPRTTRGSIDSLLAMPLVCHEDHELFKEEDLNVWLVDVPEGATVYEIRSTADWVALVERFPRELAKGPAEWERWTDQGGPWVLPDWKSFATKYDAVHVSFAAYLASAYTAIPIGAANTILIGWHPDETLWLGRAPNARERLR